MTYNFFILWTINAAIILRYAEYTFTSKFHVKQLIAMEHKSRAALVLFSLKNILNFSEQDFFLNIYEAF